MSAEASLEKSYIDLTIFSTFAKVDQIQKNIGIMYNHLGFGDINSVIETKKESMASEEGNININVRNIELLTNLSKKPKERDRQ